MAISTIGQNGLTNPLPSLTTNTVTSAPATALAIQSGGTTAITVDTSQNVGIGTSPSVALDVSSTANSTSGQLRIASSGSNGTRMGFISTSTNGKTYQIGSNFITGTGEFGIYDATAAATRMVIGTSGKLFVGNTGGWTAVGAIGALQYLTQGLAVGDGATSVSINNDRIYFNASQYYVLNESSAGVRLANGSTAWVAQSDETVKDIIEPISDALNKVDTLRAVIGKYKTDEEGTRRSFLIAQDVQAVLPEAVDLDENDNTLGLRYTEVIPLLVAAIKELNAKVDAQAAEIAALKGAK